MRGGVAIHGLEPRQGETAFAFLVLRLSRPMERGELVGVIRQIAPMIPDAERILEGFSEEIDEAMKIVGMPWLPPEEDGVEEQRALIEEAAARGVEAAWFFQTGTSLPSTGEEGEGEEEEDDDDDDDDEEEEDDDARGGADEDRVGDGHGLGGKRNGKGDGANGTEVEAALSRVTASAAASPDDNWDELLVGDVTDPHTPQLSVRDEDRDDDLEDEGKDAEVADDEDADADAEVADDEGEDGDADADAEVADDEGEDGDEDELEEDEDEEDEEDEDDDDEESWSHGPPPQRTEVPFPVDGYPAIIEALDWEDFGISFKLAGPFTPGESTVLLGIHALWLSPYGPQRYRNAAVTIDRRHHSAHLWVDRFAVPCSAEEQVGHLLWVLSKLHEVTPVLHARFGGASMAEKYGGLMGDPSELFVLGGNPLLAVHAAGGESDVDLWIAEQTDWSKDEVAQMLRELAEQIVMSGAEDEEAAEDDDYEDDEDDEDTEGQRPAGASEDDEVVDAVFASGDEEDEEREDQEDEEEEEEKEHEAKAGGIEVVGFDDDEDDADDDDEGDDDSDADEGALEEDEDSEDDGEDEDEEGAEDEDEDEDEEDEEDDEDEDDSRQITTYAGELLIARARAGTLDARAVDALRSVLGISDRHEHRRTAVVGILGALRDHASVPAMIRILDEQPSSGGLDSVGKEDLLAETASVLGTFGDPAAIPALARLAAAHGRHNDRPRPAAAVALAACLAATPEPRDVDDAVVGAMLEAIAERANGELVAELAVACGQLARQLSPLRRAEVRLRLAETELALEDPTAVLARHAALVLAGSGGPLDAGTSAAMRPLLHAALTEISPDYGHTVRRIRIALGVAELLPELVEPADLIWLVRLPEPDVRARAHALLERLHHGMAPAPCFDARAARELSDGELIERLGDPHVVGRAALAGEIARRDLAAGRAAVRAAVQEVADRTPPGEVSPFAPDARLLELAVPWLREGDLDEDAIGLFDRLLRHSNHHVKWELLQEPPLDERLLGGMLYVLAERWSWQAEVAREWLRRFEGTAAFEAARQRAGIASLDLAEEASEGEDDEEGDAAGDDEDDDEDDQMN